MDTPEGQTVKLSDFISKNKYTLIDSLWASWCGPLSQRNAERKVAAYKEFKNKGFGIVGVSLDNNLDKWKEAITALDITWPADVLICQGWNNAGAKLYGVNSIPATVLVDQERVPSQHATCAVKILKQN
ncbi:MAG: peroxiredoxin family protein [Phocaeicola vulgatus]